MKKEISKIVTAVILGLSMIMTPISANTAKADTVYSSGEKVSLSIAIPAYMNASDAANGTNSIGKRYPGTYYVYRSYAGMINISASYNSPGAWVNPADMTISETPDAGDRYTLSTSTKVYLSASDANFNTGSVGSYEAGTYYVYKTYNGMLNISRYPGTPGAWINPTAVSAPKDPEPTTAEIVLAAANSLLGAPYVWGGESWSEGGFDCSGLTYYSYKKAGITLPRTSSQQWAGISQKVSVPKPGDIIAFERYGSVYHVGIYIGDNKMIHSPKPGYFVEVKDLSWYWNNDRVKGFLRPTK